MEYEFVQIEGDGRVATVRFDRGDDINALSPQLMRELLHAARSFEDDIETSVVILTGTARTFTYGYDLKDPDSDERARAGLARRRQMVSAGAEALPGLGGAGAADHRCGGGVLHRRGRCPGGGPRLPGVGPGASFLVPEIKLGMNMGWQSLPRLVSLIGPAPTKQLAIMADTLPARVAEMPPVPVRMIKQSVTLAANALGHAVLYMDRDQFALAASSEDYQGGVQAFREKRPPRFTGR